MNLDGLDQAATLSFRFAGWLFTWSWQVLLVLGIAWLGAKLDRSHNPVARYRVWLIAALVATLLPLLVMLGGWIRWPVPVATISWPAISVGDFRPTGFQSTMPDSPSRTWILVALFWWAGAAGSFLNWANSLRK